MLDQPELFVLPAIASGKFKLQEPIVRHALVEDGCRFWLKRAWGAGPCIMWAMANPSNADSSRDDPTMKRVMEFSATWGFGSCVVINPIPLISSTPAAALKWAQAVGKMDHTYEDPIWRQWNANIGHCMDVIHTTQAHIAAWGNIIDPVFVSDWLECVIDPGWCGIDYGEPLSIEWLCLGTNSNGSPRHPLSRGRNRVPADFKPIPWKH